MNLANEAERAKLEELFKRHASVVNLMGTYHIDNYIQSVGYFGPTKTEMMDLTGFQMALTELGITTWEKQE